MHAVAQPARIVGDVQNEGAVSAECQNDLSFFEIMGRRDTKEDWIKGNAKDTKGTKDTKDTKASMDTKVSRHG